MNKEIKLDEVNGTVTCEYGSTNVKSTLYHIKTKHLEVEFARGNRITYYPVDVDMHCKLMLAESIGKAFIESVQKNTKLQFYTGDRLAFLTEQTKNTSGKIERK